MSGGFFMTEKILPSHIQEAINQRFNSENLVNNPVIGYTLLDILQKTKQDHPLINFIKETLGNNPTRAQFLEAIASQVLEINNLEQLNQLSAEKLKPYKTNGQDRSTLIISSATPHSDAIKTEKGCYTHTGHIVDMPGAIESRDTHGAKDGDVSVISTPAGLAMSKDSKAKIIDITQAEIMGVSTTDIYFKSDIILGLILTQPDSEILQTLVEEIKKNPIIYPYNLDEETQIALLWLANQAGLKKLDVSANSAEVGRELTRKGFWHPTAKDALQVEFNDDPYEMQEAEWGQSQAAKDTKLHLDHVPGYVVNHDNDLIEFQKQIFTALMLHSTRYEFDTVWIKPDRGTDGGNQGALTIGEIDQDTRIEINNLIDSKQFDRALELFKASIHPQHIENIEEQINNMQDSDWVIQALTHYFGDSEKIAPSIHIINGQVQETISIQSFMPGNDKEWGGNTLLSYQDWEQLIDDLDENQDPRLLYLRQELKHSYHQVIEQLQKYLETINNSEKYKDGLVRGGIDIAFCTLGGKFKNEKLITSFQDHNIRANGCETARSLNKKIQEKYPGYTSGTRNFSPKNYDLHQMKTLLPQVCEYLGIPEDQVELIAVAKGWGQVGIIGRNTKDVKKRIDLIEDLLRGCGAIL